MAIEVTEDPLKNRLSLRPPWRAYREFIVTGTNDASAALAAVDGTSGVSIPQADDAYPAYSHLRCVGPDVRERKGVEFWCIGCDYEIPAAGNATIGGTDPLLEKPWIEWNAMTISEPTDIDIDGRPIMNAAGDTLSASRFIRGFSFTVTRNEPFFDILKSEEYSMMVSDRDITIGGVIFPAETLALMSIAPTSRYQFGARYVNIGYYFERLPRINPYPFQHRFINAGDQGWYTSGSGPSKGRFTNADDQIVDSIKLNLDGTPFVPTGEVIKVANNAAIANPTAVDFYDVETLPDNGGFAIYFKKYRVGDLTPILFND